MEVERPFTVELENDAARDPLLTGGKAAALARAASAGLATLPGVVLTTAFCDEVDAGADVADHPAVRDAFVHADGEVTVTRCAELVGGRGHGRVVHGRSVRVDRRHQRVRCVRHRGPDRARLPRTRRRCRLPDRRARPTADRAEVRRRDVRHRPGVGSNRPQGHLRGAGRARASGERRGRRLEVRARRSQPQGSRVRRQRRSPARSRRSQPARVAVGQGRRGLRRAAGRRVGHQSGRAAVAAPVAPGHVRDPGCAARAGVRAGPGRGDVSVAADGARGGSLGPAASRSRSRGRAAGGGGDAGGRRGERRRRLRRRARCDRPAARGRDPAEAQDPPQAQPDRRFPSHAGGMARRPAPFRAASAFREPYRPDRRRSRSRAGLVRADQAAS